jgi:pilus assembly protein CpaB
LDSNTTFSTGGDVSRFQRRTVPASSNDKVAQASKAMGQALGAALGVPQGPVVRVARGNNVTVVPVGAR